MTKAELLSALADFPDTAIIHVRDLWSCGAMFTDAAELRAETRSDWNRWDGEGEVPTITVIEIDT